MEAYRIGGDVFLTTARRVLRRDAATAPHGLRLLPPSGLVDELAAAGVAGSWAPDSLQGLAPDLGRMSALIEALGG